MMKRKMYRTMLELTHNPIYTLLLRRFVQSNASKHLNRSFSNAYKLNEDEMEKQLVEYTSLHDLFIRRLKSESRPISQEENSVVSPVDGQLSELGKVSSEASFTIKGKEYDLKTMLGLPETAKRYVNGTYMLFYLSPKDYHRIHSPVHGQVTKRYALGKYSEPVNQLGLLLGDSPLAKNYRIITEVISGCKKIAVVKIGALNVNSVHMSHLNETVEKGEEMAYFTFGSSVILLFEEGAIRLTEEQACPRYVKQGETIAYGNDE
ncbi:phosphatidylserine decarboxylase [Bacillus shivajii]|uniref:phosphatidylserine decarboxylase n=1 Tax=Bacillus shivajii TaxID=1983719 RepID=UPI001CFB645D|nr:phosphatidylserine decarboxylase [Bacillus shivajii]UCZ54439.1 phosphatidylserine decarboxylase [Bacillus shivajii]